NGGHVGSSTRFNATRRPSRIASQSPTRGGGVAPMDSLTGAGLVAGSTGLATLMLLSGDRQSFVADHAVIPILAGSFRATMIRLPLGAILHGVPLGAKFAFTMSRLTARDLVDELARIAEIARKQGPVGLEKVETDDPFLAKGIRYIADGYDLEFIRDN